MAFVDIADVKVLLGIELTDQSQDPWLIRAVKSASSQFEVLTGKQFSRRIAVERVQQPTGFRRLALSRRPVISVTSVTLNGEPVDSELWTVEDEAAGFLIRTDGRSWTGTDVRNDTLSGGPPTQPVAGYEVDYESGYDEVPYEVQDAVAHQVAFLYRMKDRDSTIESMTVLGDNVKYRDTTSTAFHPSFVAMVDRYRAVVVL
jgi:hypothetical protein